MKKNIIKKIILKTGLLAIFTLLLLPSIQVFASNHEYTVLAPLPGTTNCADNRLGADCKTTLQKYLPGVFKLAIGLSAVFAVLMIVLGGLQYMSTDAVQGKSEGKERIKNAIYGLVLVIGAWLILNTINPGLLNFNLNIEKIQTSAPAGGTLAPVTSTDTVVTRTRATCPNCEINLSATYRISDANLARINCPTCARMDQSIPIRSDNTNTNVEPGLNNSLLALNNGLREQGVNWGVTEAFPPTVNHVSGCHYSGTCIDAGLTNPTATNVKRFIDTANNNGLRAQYEVRTEAERQTMLSGLRSAGMTGNLDSHVIVVGTINNAHFSVYKP